MFDLEKLEVELYNPIREVSHIYAIDDPRFRIQFDNCIDSFIGKHPQFNGHREVVYNMALANLQGYITGRIEERSKLEILKIGVDGARLLIGSILEYQKLRSEGGD